MCDLLVDNLRSENEDIKIYNINYQSPEELNGLECNDRSVIWSIGCILYEIINKKLPFSEDDDMNKTKENILRCNYNLDNECDEMMKAMLLRMLIVNNENRISLKELRKEMIKMSEIIKDEENVLMIYKERKDLFFNNDNVIVSLPITYPKEYYIQSDKWKEIRKN